MAQKHHHHGHHHHAPPATDQGRIFLIAVALNALFIAVELFYGFAANSLALLADAGHNASDVLGLLMAWGAMVLGRRQPSGRFTYGLQSVTIMAALANALLLLGAVAGILWEAVGRFSHPQGSQAMTMIVVALIGTVINALTAWILQRGHMHDLNVRGAYLHMVADAGISLGVVVSGVLIMATGWLWVDPVVSIAIALMIVVGTWRLLRDSTGLALHAVPRSVDIDEVKSYLTSQSGVTQVHDLHVWAMSTTSIALSAHLLIPSGHPGDAFIHQVSGEMAHRFGIDHVTLQIETSDHAQACRLSDHAV